MFPTLYHFFKLQFGLEINFLQVVNTFGFFVALSIAGAYYIMTKELKRKTILGLFSTVQKTITIGKPNPLGDYILNGIFAFIFGYKILYLALNAGGDFVPQDHTFNSDGNLLLGLAAVVLVLGIKYYQDKKQRLPEPQEKIMHLDASAHMGNITAVALISGFFGAKLFHNLEDLHGLTFKTFFTNFFSQDGWAFYGGLLLGGAGVLFYAWRKKLNVLSILDCGAPMMMLAYGIGRFGCHFSGDGDWGVSNLKTKPFSILPDWLWAYKYPNNVQGRGMFAPEGMEQIAGQKGEFSYQLIEPVWPTPLYEALMALLIFAFIWYFLRKKIQKPGALFGIYMILAGTERFLIELIREHGTSLYKWGKVEFSQAQLISSLLIFGGVILYLYCKNRKAKDPILTEA